MSTVLFQQYDVDELADLLRELRRILETEGLLDEQLEIEILSAQALLGDIDE